MRLRNWLSSAESEIDSQLPQQLHEISVGVLAARAGTARRRLRRIAGIMTAHGYSLHIVSPVKDGNDGRWSTARFRNPKYAPADDEKA